MGSDGWNRYIWTWEFNALALNKIIKYAGWDRNEDEEPYSVLMEIHDAGTSLVRSREIAIEWDDECEGAFYYRDWNSGGSPFLADGEVYWSRYWFQWFEDAKTFQERYGGVGTWMDEHDEFLRKCQGRGIDEVTCERVS